MEKKVSTAMTIFVLLTITTTGCIESQKDSTTNEQKIGVTNGWRNINDPETENEELMLDIRITNNRSYNITIINITLDGDELVPTTIPSNTTYKITGLDPDIYPKGVWHSLEIIYDDRGGTYFSRIPAFKTYCYTCFTAAGGMKGSHD